MAGGYAGEGPKEKISHRGHRGKQGKKKTREIQDRQAFGAQKRVFGGRKEKALRALCGAFLCVLSG
jgi:hypothetical protein